MRFDICIYCKIITTVALTTISILSHNYHLFQKMLFKISKLQKALSYRHMKADIQLM